MTNREQLKSIIKQLSIQHGEFTLSSGKKSNIYIDMRLTTLSTEGAGYVSQLVLREAIRRKATSIAGPIVAACPLISGALTLASIRALDEKSEYESATSLFNIKGNYIRKQAKDRGMGKLIEGPELTKYDRVLMVDDVLTSGGSIEAAIETIQQTEAKVVGIFVILDREEGGKERLSNYPVTSVFTLKELL